MTEAVNDAPKMGYKQEMAPPGGYKEFVWKRTFRESMYTWRRAWVAMGIFQAGAWWIWFAERKRKRALYVEENDALMAMRPFQMAERDRRVLRMWRTNLELEDEVMKDVEGWKSGTFWGEPVYFTTYDGKKWYDPPIGNHLVHAPRHQYRKYRQLEYHDDLQGPHFWEKWAPDWYMDRLRGFEVSGHPEKKFGAEIV